MAVKSKKEKPNYKIPLMVKTIVFLYDARNENLKKQPTYEKYCDIGNLTKEELMILKKSINHVYGEY